MKVLLKLILCLLVVLRNVRATNAGTESDKTEKPGSDDVNKLPNFFGGSVQKIREELPQLIKNISELRNVPLNQGTSGLGLGTVYNTLLGGVHSLYQDLLNRQQAFINLLTCGNCVNEGWQAIMDVALLMPELEWVYKPYARLPTTFFTAVHQNGTVTGIGGSIVDGKPIAEYAFGNDGIAHNLPKKRIH